MEEASGTQWVTEFASVSVGDEFCIAIVGQGGVLRQAEVEGLLQASIWGPYF